MSQSEPSATDLSRRPGRVSSLEAALQLTGLWTVAVVMPLLDLMGRNAPFLLFHQLATSDLALIVAFVALAPPAGLVAVKLVAGRVFGPEAGDRVHGIAVGALAAAFLLVAARKLGDPLPAWLVLPMAAGAWLLVARITVRSTGVRQFLMLLSAALPVSLVGFGMSPAAEALDSTGGARRSESEQVRPGDAGSQEGGRPSAPIVFVVFDELPLLSLLDGALGIDEELCPHLADFAETATWYRNASTVWGFTAESIVSMLTGRVADTELAPTRESYPENLLTWLEPSHEIHAVELLTRLAPPAEEPALERRPRPERMRGFLGDLAVVALHLVTPDELGRALPAIDGGWGHFRDFRVVRRRGGETRPAKPPVWEFALYDGRSRKFAKLLESIEAGSRPGLWFAHVMLPHKPSRYLPSGRVYGGRPIYGTPAPAWLENEWFALEVYQRHMLQVGFVDRLVGDLVARLKEQDLFDDSLVVITSDHGASYWPGENRREPAKTAHPDDILRIPLLIKAPGQVTGAVSDRNVETIDILPTINDLLGSTWPWPSDGLSAVSEAPARSFKILLDHKGGRLELDPDFDPDRASLERKLELFTPQAGTYRWVKLGPHRELVGRRAEELSFSGGGECTATVDQLPVLMDQDPESFFVPAQLTGSVRCRRSLSQETYLAVAVNGTVGAIGRLQGVAGGSGLFSAMLPEEVLVEGMNEIDAILVSGPPDRPSLRRVRVAPPGDASSSQ